MKNLAKLAKKQRELKELYNNSTDPRIKDLTLRTMRLVADTLVTLIRSYEVLGKKGLQDEEESTEEIMD